uniref:C2H2-type domain-containing protein n=1 Tax=Pseudonaja textilis TaxID=8673 RepID=A0A670YN19_PSETE
MSLKSHLRTHTEEKRHKCPDCGRSFRVSSQLPSHHCPAQATQEQEEGQRDGSYSFQRGQGTSSPDCSICPKQYSNLMALRNHVRVHLRAARMRGKELGDGLTCSNCGESFEEEAEFQLHQLRHLPCTEDIEAAEVSRLGVLHSQEADLLQTIKQDVEALENGATVAEDILPASEMPQICHQCGLAFPTVASLQTHTSQASSPLPDDSEGLPYLCEQCGLGFHQAKNLIEHRQTHQAGIYQCSLCPKEYPTLLALKHHFHGHAKEQPFLCSLCGMIFPSEESLQDHHSLLHEEGEGRSDSPHVLKRETEEQLDGGGDPEEEVEQGEELS